ncbi:MAG TPA: hypothetical protein VHT03_03265 [Rhizomicrobium sp.]|nr:hypothetical protein [Rhizomicrobium sp.]
MRFLELAEAAREMADRVMDLELRSAYRRVAIHWISLAADVEEGRVDNTVCPPAAGVGCSATA